MLSARDIFARDRFALGLIKFQTETKNVEKYNKNYSNAERAQ